MSGIDFEKVLAAVGEKGKYQTVMFFILCIPATLPVAFLAFSNVFTNATPDHWCKVPENYYKLNISSVDLKHLTIPYTMKNNGDIVYSKCSMYENDIFEILNLLKSSENRAGSHRQKTNYNTYLAEKKLTSESVLASGAWKKRFDELNQNGTFRIVSCKYGWNYDRTYYDHTLTTDFDLVCDDNWWPHMSTALFYIGSLFGNILFGWIADRWGRRPSILWMITLEVILSIAACFSRDYVTYLVMRTLGGFFFPSLYQIPFILGIEMMSPSHRTLAGILISLCFAGSMCILSLLAFLLRDWHSLSIAISVPFLLLFSYYWIIPESPRWLVSQGRFQEAEKILQKIAIYNGTSIPNGYLQSLQDAAIALEKEKRSNTVKCQEVNCNNQHYVIVNSENTGDEPDAKKFRHNLRATISGEQTRTSEGPKDKRPHTFPLENISNKNGQQDTDTSESDNSILISNKNLQTPDILYNSQSVQGRRGSEDTGKFSDPRSSLMKSVCLQTDPIPLMDNNEATLLDIFRYPNIRKKFFLLTFDWIANAVVYNGLSYNATNLGVNDFLAFFISAIVEVPSYLLAWLIMERWGRRWTLCITLGTGGIGCLCCMFVPEEYVWITVGLAMLGKFGVAASFSVFYVFVGELFPTVVRSQAMGLASLLVSVGLLSFPYILQLGHISRVIPLIILGALSISGSIASIFLPETLNEPLPQTLQEGEEFGKDFKIFSWPKKKE